jgi:hypothetical protein
LLLQDFERARDAYRAAFEVSRDDADRFGAGASAFALDPATAIFDFEELAMPSASGDPAVSQLSVKFMLAIENPDTRLDLAHQLVDRGQTLLAIPVLARVDAGASEEAAARALMEGIYRAVDFPLP